MSAPTDDARKEAMAAAVREARSARGLSQSLLATKIGVDVKTIGRIENAQMVPNLSLIWALADALGVPIGRLAADHTSPPPAKDDLASRVGALEQDMILTAQRNEDVDQAILALLSALIMSEKLRPIDAQRLQQLLDQAQSRSAR